MANTISMATSIFNENSNFAIEISDEIAVAIKSYFGRKTNLVEDLTISALFIFIFLNLPVLNISA